MKNQSNWRNFIRLNNSTLIIISRILSIEASTHTKQRTTKVCSQIQSCFQWSRAISRKYKCVNRCKISEVISLISLRVNPLMKQAEMIWILHNSFSRNQQPMPIQISKLSRWSDNPVNNIGMKRSVNQRLESSRIIYTPRTSSLEKKNKSKTKFMKGMAHHQISMKPKSETPQI